MKVCVASEPKPLLAVMVRIAYVPTVPRAGVPASTPVAGVKVTADGSAPVRDRVGDGVPVAVTVKVPGKPTVKVVVLALAMFGATPSANVRLADML